MVSCGCPRGHQEAGWHLAYTASGREAAWQQQPQPRQVCAGKKRLSLQLAELLRPAAHPLLPSLSKAALAGPWQAGTWAGHSGRQIQVTPTWSDLVVSGWP